MVWAAVEFVGGDRVIERYHGPIGRFCCRLGSVCVHAHMIILEYIENRLRCMLQSALLDGKDRTGPRSVLGVVSTITHRVIPMALALTVSPASALCHSCICLARGKKSL